MGIYLVMAEREAVPAGEAEGQQRGQRGHEAEPAHPDQPQHLPANQRRGLWSRDQLSTNHSSPPTQTSLSISRPIRGEDCGHVTSSPPITAHRPPRPASAYITSLLSTLRIFLLCFVCSRNQNTVNTWMWNTHCCG